MFPFKKTKSTTLVASKNGDNLGSYPTANDAPVLSDRRAMWTARAFAVYSVASTLLNVVTINTLNTLLPLKEVQPWILTTANRTEQIISLKPALKEGADLDAMAESVAREYVLNRASIVADDAEQLRLWGPRGYVAHRSTPEEYIRFKKNVETEGKLFHAQNHTREVLVRSIKTISRGFISIDMTYIDRDDADIEIGRSYWTASLTYAYNPTAVSYEDRWVNPFGFRVTKYATTTRAGD